MNRSKAYEDASAKEYFKKLEQERLEQLKFIKEKHKCNNCVWAKGNDKYCMFPKCFEKRIS